MALVRGDRALGCQIPTVIGQRQSQLPRSKSFIVTFATFANLGCFFVGLDLCIGDGESVSMAYALADATLSRPRLDAVAATALLTRRNARRPHGSTSTHDEGRRNAQCSISAIELAHAVSFFGAISPPKPICAAAKGTRHCCSPHRHS